MRQILCVLVDVNVLTVVIIVIILAAMLPPFHATCQERARWMVCRSNLREIGKGCMMYTGDFGDYYPTVKEPGGETRPLASLALLYDAYVSANKIFICPSTTDTCRDMEPGATFRPHGIEPKDGVFRQCSFAYDDTRGPDTSCDIVILAHALPDPLHHVRDDSGFGCSCLHSRPGQFVLMWGGDMVLWTTSAINPLIPGDDIYSAADPKNPGASDSYIHQ